MACASSGLLKFSPIRTSQQHACIHQIDGWAAAATCTRSHTCGIYESRIRKREIKNAQQIAILCIHFLSSIHMESHAPGSILIFHADPYCCTLGAICGSYQTGCNYSFKVLVIFEVLVSRPCVTKLLISEVLIAGNDR